MRIPVGASSLALSVILVDRTGLPCTARPTDKPSTVQRSGSQPSTKGSPEWFTGSVWVDPMLRETAPSSISGGLVTFEPEARTARHTHPFGQTLIVTAGPNGCSSGVAQFRRSIPATWCASRPT